jgi:2',3'-cyclic-nucleotide 3'-phosphodiesterase
MLSSAGDVSEEKRSEVEGLLLESGISLDGQGEMSGWTGGSLWLVPTFKPIEEWKPLAERKLNDNDDSGY